MIESVLKKDPIDYWCQVENCFLEKGSVKDFSKLDNQRGDALIRLQEMLEMIVDYLKIGAYDESIKLIDAALAVGKPYTDSPMPFYYKGYALFKKNGQADQKVKSAFAEGSKRSPDYCFPFRTEELDLFKTVLAQNPNDARCWYYYGNLLYYLTQKENGIAAWEKSTQLDPNYGRVWRNLGFAYNQAGQVKKAIAAYENAIAKDGSDPRVFSELDVIYSGINKPAAERLELMSKHLDTVLKHDDAVIQLVGLYNETGNYAKAIDILGKRHFRVWEGGRAVHNSFVDAHLMAGLDLLKNKKYEQAIKEFEIAETYPRNLEVGRVIGGGQNAKIFYLIGRVYEAMGKTDQAKKAYSDSANPELANVTPDSEISYFQIMALRKIGKNKEADLLLKKFADSVKIRIDGAKKFDEFSKFGEDGTAAQRTAYSFYLNGLVQLANNDKAGADKSFADALKLNPNLIWPKFIKRF